MDEPAPVRPRVEIQGVDDLAAFAALAWELAALGYEAAEGEEGLAELLD